MYKIFFSLDGKAKKKRTGYVARIMVKADLQAALHINPCLSRHTYAAINIEKC